MKMLDAMIECEPLPPWPANPHVFVFGLDQCNHWQAARNTRKAHFRGSERLDASGMPVVIRSETVCNVVQRHIPFTLGLLSPAEQQLIKEEGPYTEDYRNILYPLEPACVKAQLRQGMAELMQIISPCTSNVNPPTVREVTAAALARPIQNLGGPSNISILPSIPVCDTKSFPDVFKFVPFMRSHDMAYHHAGNPDNCRHLRPPYATPCRCRTGRRSRPRSLPPETFGRDTPGGLC